MDSNTSPEGVSQLIWETLQSETLVPADLPLELKTVLVGPGAICDSVGLVGFLVALEESISDRFGASLSLMDEKAMSREKSPFRSVASLTEFVLELLRA